MLDLGFVLLSGMAGETTAEYVGVSQIPIFLAPLVLSLLFVASAAAAAQSQPASCWHAS